MARPRGMRRGKYRMTPARRAALRKAQKASANKRRRKAVAGAVGKTMVNVGGLFVAARISTYIAHPGKIKKDYRNVKGLFSRKQPINTVPKSLQTARMTWIP
jgi:hypothetical protein